MVSIEDSDEDERLAEEEEEREMMSQDQIKRENRKEMDRRIREKRRWKNARDKDDAFAKR